MGKGVKRGNLCSSSNIISMYWKKKPTICTDCTTLYFYVLAPTCFGSSLPSSWSLLDPPKLLENTNWGLVYHITCGYVACVPDCRGSVCCVSLCPAPLYNIFPHYLINGTILEKKMLFEYKMCIVIFSTAFVWNISYFIKNWARYDKNVYWCSCKVPVILVRF
jgi:hypothetical protein